MYSTTGKLTMRPFLLLGDHRTATGSARSMANMFVRTITTLAISAFVALATFALAPRPAAAEGIDIRAHLKIDDNATAAATPFSVYPGATRTKRRGNSTEGVKIDFALGSFGFKLDVVTLMSNDSPEKIAAYYRRELSRYGEVLDCSLSRKDPERMRIERETKLRCKNNRADEGVTQFRAGRKNQEYVVVIEPRRTESRGESSGALTSGSEISLVYVNLAKNGEPIESRTSETSIEMN